MGNVINFVHNGESAECVFFSADSETISSFMELRTKENTASISLVINHAS